MKPAHVHLISVVLAELQDLPPSAGLRRLRLLDIGCGYGGLMCDLQEVFRTISGVELELYGYEVFDHRASTPGYFDEVAKRLEARWPGGDWGDRVRVGEANDPWPFDTGFFDLAISNQVLEHVADLERLFRETRRVVKPGGKAIHFYPSRAVLVEPHCGVPAAHWLSRGPIRRRWLRWLSAAGFGKFRAYREERGCDLEGYCREFSNYLNRYVHFRSNREVRRLGRAFSERCGFKYDGGLIRRALRDDWEPYAYRTQRSFRSRSLLSPLASSTLVLSL